MQLLSLSVVYADGNHNAFTGIGEFGGEYHLAFRQAQTHSALGGHQARMTSANGENWEFRSSTTFPAPPELPEGTPMDLRDNSFLRCGDELRIYSFVHAPLVNDEYLRPTGTTLRVLRAGQDWSAPKEIFSGAILWKPIFWQGGFWCAGYRRLPGQGTVVELYSSNDGWDWERGPMIASGNETCLVPISGDGLRAYVRTHRGGHYLEIWESHHPYKSWTQKAVIPKIIQAPHLQELDDRLFLLAREVTAVDAVGRPIQPSATRSKVWEAIGHDLHEVLELPSLGDCAYFGTAIAPDGSILASYYSQHEQDAGAPPESRGGNDKAADVFVARLKP